MAEIAIAGKVASPLIKLMIDNALSFIGCQYNWAKDIRRNLEKLKIALIGIQTVVAEAERQQSLNTSQERLLSLLKDVVYEADDLLDEYEYLRLEAQAMEDRGMVSRRASSSLKFAKRLIGKDELPRKLKEILNKLNQIKEEAKIFNIQAVGSTITSASEQVLIRPHRDSSSFPSSRLEILGRDKEKDKLINLLRERTNESISSYTNISIITIVGLGGIGKTTLAQEVYNDGRIKGLFDLRMWICVSDNFDEKTLTRKILECASGSTKGHKDVDNLNILKENLKKELESKKFLLVLDDVWIDKKRGQIKDQEIWEKIFTPINDGTRGNKILVTTREDRVATILGTTSPIHLKGLNDDVNWSILERKAFGGKIPDNHQELKEIGMEIIQKLKGSPLAANVVGAMLQYKLDPKQWSNILKMESFVDVMSVLRLSYENLEEHLKFCFAYCSIFPKDSEFESEKLVLLWIAQGYVQHPSEDGRSMMDIGMDHFNQLLSRSFFQKSEQASYECYIMHDIIHDLAQNVSLDECFRIDGGKQREIPQTIRHLGVHFRGEEEFQDIVLGLEKMQNIKNLRSLIFFGWADLGSTSHQLVVDMLKKLRSLRVLDLNELDLGNFQGVLSHLRHLRYLHLGDNSSGNLPESVYRLYHLSRLDVGYLQVNVEKKKKNRGVGALQFMKVVFPVQLCINNLQYCSGREEALQADLGSKHCLNSLKLEWGSSGRIVGHDADAEVAEALKPHPNLKDLEIKGFGGSRLPSWLDREWLLNLPCRRLTHLESLHLTSLRRLEVSNCPNLTSFPLFPRTPRDIFVPIAGSVSLLKLEESWPETGFVLTICGIPQSDRAFLHDHQLRAIHELWIEDGNEAATPAGIAKAATLKKLSITWCPELLMSKNMFMFESLMIDDCPNTDSWLSRCLQGGLTSLSMLNIINCTGLTSLPSAEVLQSLTTLQVLEICACKDLKSLGGIHALAALKKLQINECPGLLTSNEDGGGALPLSLESLRIYDCPITDRWLSRSLQGGLTSLSELNITTCTGLTSLPSTEVLQGLTALQVLVIRHCEDLTSLGGLHALAALKQLNIEECPGLLTSNEDGCGALPLSLESLSIKYCPITDSWLSICLQGGLTSLSELNINTCTGLMSLPSAEVLQSLTALQVLVIWFCDDLTSLGGLHVLAALKRLEINECPGLLTSNEDGGGALPSSLEELEIYECPITDRWLSRSLQGGLTSLSKLNINKCTGLTSLPSAEVRQSLTALQVLEIWRCENLTSLGGLHALAALKKLEINTCPGLLTSNEDGGGALPLSLESLSINECPITDRWLSTCLQGGLTSLSKLNIQTCTGLTSLPSAEVLQSLTALQVLEICRCEDLTSLGGLHVLVALKRLQVEDCPNMKSLPEDAMPASIEHLILRGCDPALQQQIHDEKGPNWEKVAHIPRVWI